MTADVTKSDDVKAYVKAAIEKYGRIDCFFNNAGIEGKVAHTAEYDEAVFDAVIGVNVKGVFLGLRHVLPEMIRQGSGASGQHRFRRRPGGDAGHAGLCGVEARRDRPHQDRGGRSRAPGHPGERRVPGAGRHAHDPCAGGTTLARQRGRGRRALPGGAAERALHDGGGDRQHGAVPLLRPRLQHHRRTIRRRWRAHRDRRRGDQSGCAVARFGERLPLSS